VLLAACTIAPGPGEPGPTDGALPSGLGTLRQEDVSIALVSGDLRILVTPLAETITRVTAPDTERRLEAVVGSLPSQGVGDGSGLFLVTLYSDRPDTRFDPEEVQLIAQGFRQRPESIEPLTPTWGERRIGQREQVVAVYRYAASIDLEAEVVLAYGQDRSAPWSQVLPRIQAERARVRSRVTLPG
jgi:hypothetical protein